MNYKTEQEHFWAGQFGSEYSTRNNSSRLQASNIAFFSKALSRAGRLPSCIEFGANIGLNLRALKLLYPDQAQHAVEINGEAVDQLVSVIPAEHVRRESILEFNADRHWELVLVKGVLIHIDPAWLHRAYESLYQACGRYVLLCEYYNPAPVSVNYRGHDNRLFKRDFCNEMLQLYPALELVDYGFAYHGDPIFPQDDITWFLMEKKMVHG